MQENIKKIHFGSGHPRPKSDKDLAIRLLFEGNSFRSVGRIIGVSHQSISKWLKQYTSSLPNEEVGDLSDGVEVDELCTFFKKVKNNKETQTAKRTWVWVGICRRTPKVVGCTVGTRGVKTFKPLYDTLVSNGCDKFYTDKYNVYQSVIDCTHVQSKAFTTHVESFWSDVRLYIKGLNRRTKCCFKKLETLLYMLRLYIHNYNLKLA